MTLIDSLFSPIFFFSIWLPQPQYSRGRQDPVLQPIGYDLLRLHFTEVDARVPRPEVVWPGRKLL